MLTALCNSVRPKRLEEAGPFCSTLSPKRVGDTGASVVS